MYLCIHILKHTKVGSGPIFGADILLEPMGSVLLSDATDDADLAKEVFLGAMVVDEHHECTPICMMERDEIWRLDGERRRKEC